jgi:cytochrome c biogenesis protein CcdA
MFWGWLVRRKSIKHTSRSVNLFLSAPASRVFDFVWGLYLSSVEIPASGCTSGFVVVLVLARTSLIRGSDLPLL